MAEMSIFGARAERNRLGRGSSGNPEAAFLSPGPATGQNVNGDGHDIVARLALERGNQKIV
jgi:hypothetical protein